MLRGSQRNELEEAGKLLSSRSVMGILLGYKFPVLQAKSLAWRSIFTLQM